MQIEKDRFVHLELSVTDDGGATLQETLPGEPLGYVHGRGDLVPGLECHLEGKRAGDEFEVFVDPERGFGERDEARVLEVSKAELGPEIHPEVGLELHLEGEDGEVVRVTVARVNHDTVILDGNHVLAGMKLHFKGKVVGVRAANADELRGCCGSCEV